jgi:hypothetical protein
MRVFGACAGLDGQVGATLAQADGTSAVGAETWHVAEGKVPPKKSLTRVRDMTCPRSHVEGSSFSVLVSRTMTSVVLCGVVPELIVHCVVGSPEVASNSDTAAVTLEAAVEPRRATSA